MRGIIRGKYFYNRVIGALASFVFVFWVGCRSSSRPQDFDLDLSPIIPSIQNVDPTKREERPFKLPTTFLIERNNGGVALSIDSSTLKDSLIDVGLNMATDFFCKTYAVSESERTELEMVLTTEFNVGNSTSYLYDSVFIRQLKTHESFVEYVLELFETDIPAQHMWWPNVSKFYKVLWADTLRSNKIVLIQNEN